MSVLNIRELLQREIAGLPEDLVREVFDFLMFVRERRTEEKFLWEQVEAAETYRRAHPDEVIRATADEWEME